MQTFVISLERTPERLAQFRAVNLKHAERIKHFVAVDGRCADRHTLVEEGVLEDLTPRFSDAQLGCALSHRALWQRCVALGEPVTIIEDDAILHDDFFGKAEALLAAAGECDYVQWGWNFDAYAAFVLPGDLSHVIIRTDQDRMRAQALAFQSCDVTPILYRFLSAFGIPAYTVTPRGAQKLLQGCFPPNPPEVYMWGNNCHFPNRGVDTTMNVVLRASDVTGLLCFPPLVLTPNDHQVSTIAGQP